MLDSQSAAYLLNKIQGFTWTKNYDFKISDIDGKILISTDEDEAGRLSHTASRMIKEYNGSQFRSPDIVMTDQMGSKAWSLITLRGFAIGAFEVIGSGVSEKSIREMTEILNILTAGYCRENSCAENKVTLFDVGEGK